MAKEKKEEEKKHPLAGIFGGLLGATEKKVSDRNKKLEEAKKMSEDEQPPEDVNKHKWKGTM